jgi:hypothetical protein
MNEADIVWPEFARKLERERDEARHKLELCMAANSDVARIAKERDEAREAWYQMQSSFERSRDEVERVIRERDEATTRRMETIMQCELYEQERDEAREQNAKLREIAERAMLFCDMRMRDSLRVELAQLKEGAK